MAPRLRLLILDDDEEDQEILKYHLETCPDIEPEITAVNTIDGALQSLEQATYDAIFLDFRLQGSGKGTDLLDRLANLPETTRLILCSGNEDGFLDPGTSQRLRSGQLRFLSKRSINAQELTDLLLE